MSDVLTPTYRDVRWGVDEWSLFDVFANPVRDTGGNPVFIYRHGGGGVTGDKAGPWATPDASYYITRYLTENPLLLAHHFDVVSFESGQTLFGGTDGRKRTRSLYKPDQMIDAKRAVCAIKHMSRRFGWDPMKFVGGGGSDGASIMMLAQLSPPIQGAGGGQFTYVQRLNDYSSFDSRMRGIFNGAGQIDVRNDGPNGVGGTDALPFQFLQGWMGTRTDISTEWDALSPDIKASISPLAYIQNGDTSFYKPFMQFYSDAGDHIHPYSNVHDSAQLTTMNAALAAAGLPYSSLLFIPGDFSYHTPGSPTPASDAICAQIYSFLASCIDS